MRVSPKELKALQQKVRGGVDVSQNAKAVRQGPSPILDYDSPLEADYATYLQKLEWGRDILAWRYHPWTFLLPGGLKYTPDFLVHVMEPLVGLHRIELIELKGSRHMKNARDSITRFHIARGLFPCFWFRLIDRYRRQWRQIA